MRADPANALGLWLHRNDVEFADVRVSARARDRYAARIVPTDYGGDYFAPVREAANGTNAVEARRDKMLVYKPERLLDELDLTEASLGECTHADCDRDADRYVLFPQAGVARDYCTEHAARAESMLTA
jgi:hypothetical protein